MSRSRSKRGREESSEEYEIGQKRLRPLPSEKRIVESKLNEGRESRILDFYSFGANDNYQLGSDEVSDEPMHFLKSISDLNCLSFVAGKDSSFVMEGNTNPRFRNVYSWGGDVECLGREFDESEQEPVVIEALSEQPMVEIAAGSSHVVALTSTGEVVSWGIYKDRSGEAVGFKSHMPAEEWMETPDLIDELADVKIIQVTATRTRSVALTETGDVYEWGETRLDDRTLERHKKDSLSPAQVLIPGKVVALYGGSNGDTVFAEDSNGEFYAWGQNNFYQCGVDDEVKRSKKVKNKEVAERNRIAKRKKLATHSRAAKAKKINYLLTETLDDEVVAKVTSGRLHTLLLTESGDVYSWGNNKFGQLGLGLSADKEVATPTKVDIRGKVVDISCGAFHSIVVTDKGDVFGFGKNKNACLGDLDDVQDTPAALNLEPKKKGKVVGVSCGSRHNLVAVARSK